MSTFSLPVLEFLKEELRLEKKHVVALVQPMHLARTNLLLRHVHTLYVVSPQPHSPSDTQTNIHFVKGNATTLPLDSDALDMIICTQPTQLVLDPHTQQEFERGLKLNSYVVLLINSPRTDTSAFNQAYSQLLAQYTTHSTAAQLPPTQQLDAFYKEGHQIARFQNQQHLKLDQLIENYQTHPHALPPHHPQYPQALKALRILFQQYQKNNEVVLDVETQLCFGLFNRYVPAISLRKSIFFQILRPFAFLFYVLVKANIYFWRFIYKIKNQLFPSKPS